MCNDGCCKPSIKTNMPIVRKRESQKARTNSMISNVLQEKSVQYSRVKNRGLVEGNDDQTLDIQETLAQLEERANNLERDIKALIDAGFVRLTYVQCQNSGWLPPKSKCEPFTCGRRVGTPLSTSSYQAHANGDLIRNSPSGSLCDGDLSDSTSTMPEVSMLDSAPASSSCVV